MPLSTLLVHVDDSPHAERRFEFACQLASAHGARLTGVAPLGLAELMTGAAGLLPDVTVQIAVDRCRERSRAALDAFERVAARFELAGIEARISDSGAIPAMIEAARYADLSIVGQYVPGEPSNPSVDLAEELILHSGRPTLVVSQAWRGEPVGRRIAAAWDGSREAVRALTDALPLLTRAERVDLLIFNSSKRPDGHGDEPGADIALWLSRHGVPVRVIRDEVRIGIGAALLSRIADLNTDLVVMGGYGHSRLREAVFGGVTRTVLETMTVPVLMAH